MGGGAIMAERVSMGGAGAPLAPSGGPPAAAEGPGGMGPVGGGPKEASSSATSSWPGKIQRPWIDEMESDWLAAI
jgi:hypothetical protein